MITPVQLRQLYNPATDAALGKVSAFTLILLGQVAACAHANELKLGTAAVLINPPAGIGMAGNYLERGHEGVIDNIFSKASVLGDGRTLAPLVVCDLISMPRWLVTEARKQLEERTGIPGANVMIAARIAKDNTREGFMKLVRDHRAPAPRGTFAIQP